MTSPFEQGRKYEQELKAKQDREAQNMNRGRTEYERLTRIYRVELGLGHTEEDNNKLKEYISAKHPEVFNAMVLGSDFPKPETSTKRYNY
jgi:hypothetical protein